MKPTTDTTLALALALDGTAAPATDEIKRLSGIAGLVDALPDPDIDQRFVARLEATLMAEFDAKFGAAPLQLVKPETKTETKTEEKTAPNVVALPRRRMVVRRALAGMVAAAMLSAMPVVAAASSLPGSPFFGIEQWRQNHAISSAHGAAKAFLVEQTARKWIGYGAQMAIIGYDASDIEATLFRAGRLQKQAADLIAKYGSDGQIAQMAGMFAEDAKALRRILPQTPASARPAVHDAIATATGLTASLVGGLDDSNATVAIPAIAESVAAEAPKSSGSGTTGTDGTKAQPKGTGGKEAAGDPTTQTRREYWETYDRTACHTIAREELNDLLVGPSALMCDVRDFDPDAWTK